MADTDSPKDNVPDTKKDKVPDTDLLKAIEGAIASAAGKDNAAADDVRKWLSLRKDYLEQNAARARRRFWLWMVGCLSGVAVLLLVLWLLGAFATAR